MQEAIKKADVLIEALPKIFITGFWIFRMNTRSSNGDRFASLTTGTCY